MADNNNRSWFTSSRERYDRELLGPQRLFVEAMARSFASIDARVRCEPRIDGSIYRINRDTRFTHDKSPYKTHADLWFWIGRERKRAPGYFVRIVPDAIWIGGGIHSMTDEQLAEYRRAVVTEPDGGEVLGAVTRLADAGHEVGDRTRKRFPAGYSADSPHAELLLYTRLHAMMKVSPTPAEFGSEDFVGWCIERFAPTSELVDWLAKSIAE